MRVTEEAHDRPPTDDAGRRYRVHRRSLAGLALAGAATVLAFVVAARDGAPFAVDVAVRDLLAGHDLLAVRGDGPVHRLAVAVTQLGAGSVLYPVLLGVCLVGVGIRRTTRELLPLLGLAAGQVVELVLFATVRRPAPGGSPGLLATTFSSGRSAAAVLGWGIIVWSVARLRAGGRTRSGGPPWGPALGAGAVVGATRVLLGLHWFTDALAGVLVGAVLLAAALALLGRAGLDRAEDPDRAVGLDPVAEPQRPRRSDVSAGTGRGGRTLRWLRSSPLAWALPVGAALVPVGSILLTPPGERLKDLLVYQGAGGVAGIGQNLYAFRTSFAMPFTYPPFAALVVEPLSRMPLGVAQALWTGATLAAVVALARTGLRPVVERIGLPLTVTAALLSSPIRSHLRFGQVGVFLVLLVALDLLHRVPDPAGRESAGGERPTYGRLLAGRGWGLGLAIAIKLTPAVFLPWLAVTRQRGRLVATLCWVGGATLLGLALLWPSAGHYLRSASRDTTRFGANDIPGNQSVRGALLRILPDPSAERVWLLTALVLVGIGTYQAVRCERGGNRLAAVGVLAALSVAVSPISWVHHLVWLFLPLSALVAAGRYRLAAAWYAVLAIGLPAVGADLRAVQPVLAELVVDGQGLTAVAAVLLLPTLVGIGTDRAPRPVVPA